MLYNNILIKDSTVLGAKVLSSLFDLSGYSSKYIKNKDELIETLESDHECDLFLYDPGIFYKNDYKFIRRIKDGFYGESSKLMDIVIISSSICNGDKKKFIDSGAKLFIPKPIYFNNFIKVIETDQYHNFIMTNENIARTM